MFKTCQLFAGEIRRSVKDIMTDCSKKQIPSTIKKIPQTNNFSNINIRII